MTVLPHPRVRQATQSGGVQPLSRHQVGPLVLGHAAHPPDRLREAVRRLATVVDPQPP